MSEVFNIGLETDLSEFTSTTGVSQSGAAALAGTSGGMSVAVTDTSDRYGLKSFTQLTSSAYGSRFYFDPNGLTMLDYHLFQLCRILAGGSARTIVELYYLSGYKLRVQTQDDSYSYNPTSYYDLTDAEHCIEFLVQFATSAVASDGFLKLWIDDVLKETVSNLDIYDASKPDSGRLGAVTGLDSGTSGTFYLDEWVLRDDDTYIGPISGASGQPMQLRGATVPWLRQWQPGRFNFYRMPGGIFAPHPGIARI